MRNIFYVFLAVLTLTACREDEHPRPEWHFDARVNDTPWSATSLYAHYSPSEKSFVVSGTRMDPRYYQEDRILLRFRSDAVSPSGAVDDFEADFSHIVGGDAISESFSASADDPGNRLTVTALDSVNQVIEGEFTLRLAPVPARNSSAFREVKSGQFKLQYTEIP